MGTKLGFTMFLWIIVFVELKRKSPIPICNGSQHIRFHRHVQYQNIVNVTHTAAIFVKMLTVLYKMGSTTTVPVSVNST